MKKILVVVAHPDDEVIGCGGTIAKHVANGDHVSILVVADGVTSRLGEYSKSEMVASVDLRVQQLHDAANILGCKKVIALNMPDNRLDQFPLIDIVKKIESVIREVAPNIVYTHQVSDVNADHVVVHKAVLVATRPKPLMSVNELFFFEILSSSEWNFGVSKNSNCGLNYFVDITDFLEKKIDAAKLYKDEFYDSPHPRSIKIIKSLAELRGSVVGVQAAEAFSVGRITH
jgi:N-acetylglucosamine malate deacetylase 1